MVSDTKAIAEYAFDLQVGLEGADVPEYDVAKTLGMASVLAVNLRGLGEIQYQSLRLVAAHYFHIRSDVLDGVLRTLADLELIKLVTTGSTIEQIIPDVPHFDNVYAPRWRTRSNAPFKRAGAAYNIDIGQALQLANEPRYISCVIRSGPSSL